MVRTEGHIENMLMSILRKNGFEEISLSHNNNDAIWANIRVQLQKLNKNVDITDDVMSAIYKKIKNETEQSTHYAYEFNKILLGGIRVGLKRPDSDEIKNVNINLFNKTSSSDNVWQVTHQVIDTEGHSRYDVTILLNGFPIVQIELKRDAVEIDQAINQINRYIATAFTDTFRFVQLFIVSNGTSTKYGINNNEKINKLFMFNWTDKDNNEASPIENFANTFLTKNNLFDIISKYIVRYNTGNGKMIVMRPYQIYAVREALKKIIKPEDIKVNNSHNGYIFHTTGSGKTLTSWKLVQLASERPEVSKVVFLVDRRDLDSQTYAEFKSIDSGIDVDNTNNTRAVLKNFQKSSLESKDKFVITTIQKLSIAIKKANDCTGKDMIYQTTFSKYRDKRVIFIIDECHRSQFGEMHQIIQRYFNNALYIGFTGTPIMDQDQTPSHKLTQELFGNQIHTYRIKDAIKDRNVLGFSVDYYNTIEEKHKEDANNDTAKNINTDEVILDNSRVNKVVDKIYEIHDRKTLNRKYTALFAVESIQLLLKYYDRFKSVNDKLDKAGTPEKKLKVSAVYTISSNEDGNVTDSAKSKYYEIMRDFNRMMHTNCNTDESFRSELVKNLRAEKEDHLDIVIVVGIFLTGFDSKMTNTMYVDKNLEWHNLIQAFSRTNRVESELKRFGNIVCFRNLKNNVDQAIARYNYGIDTDNIITKSYRTILNELFECIDKLLKYIPDNNIVDKESELVKKQFIEDMREVNKHLTEAKQQMEFNWKDIEDRFKGKFDEQRYAALVGQMKQIKLETESSNDKESILDSIDFCMELVETDEINTEYIKKLIKTIDLTNIETMKASIDNIRSLLNKSVDDKLKNKADLIRRFLDKLVLDYNNFTKDDIDNFDLNDYFKKYIIYEQENELKQESDLTGIKKEDLEEEIVAYSYINKVDEQRITEKATKAKELKLKERKGFRRAIIDFISGFQQKFNDLLN